MFRVFWLCLNYLYLADAILTKSIFSWDADKRTIRQRQQEYTRRILNPNKDPCSDFFTYSCGNWSSVIDIPEEELSYSVSDVVTDEILENLNETLSNEAISPIYKHESIIHQAKDYYDSCMNVDLLQQRGIQPLKDLLESFKNCPALDPNWNNSASDWTELIAQLRLLDEDYIIEAIVGPDFRNSSNIALYIDQPLLWSADKNDYNIPWILYKYKLDIKETILELGGGEAVAERVSQEIVDFETRLASISRNGNERGHRSQLYNRTTIGELQRSHPLINWEKYLSTLLQRAVGKYESVYIEARYLSQLMKVLTERTPEQIYNYVLIRFALSKRKFVLTFYDDGVKDWWKTCVKHVLENMGLAVVHIFQSKYLPEKTVEDVNEISHNVKKIFKNLLEDAVWLDVQAKASAIKKLERMSIVVGWSKQISERENILNSFHIMKEKFFESSMEIIRLNNAADMMKKFHLDSVFDFEMTSAHYDVGTNAIVLPFGLLQLPLYHPTLPQYQKYGIVGAIIAHEMAHGFDNIGRNYDYRGEESAWLDQKSLMAFNKRAECFAQQYNKFNIDGNYSLSENIADNVSVKVAYLAYKDWLKENQRNPKRKWERIGGLQLTSEQLFFVNFVQWRCDKIWYSNNYYTDPNDSHPPERIRIAGTVENSNDFAEHFECNTNKKRCELW